MDDTFRGGRRNHCACRFDVCPKIMASTCIGIVTLKKLAKTLASRRLCWLLILGLAGAMSCRYVIAPEPIDPAPTSVVIGSEPEPPAPNSQPAQVPGTYITYIAQEGDTLALIAKQFGIAPAYLAAINLLTYSDVLYPGQEIIIPTPPAEVIPEPIIIGHSTGEHPIEVYRFGQGPIRVALIGGIHGGAEWNSILLAYQVIDYYAAFPAEIPDAIRLYIIPTVNPDGQFLVTAQEGRFSPDDVAVGSGYAGRFNANGVDLNRNWSCNWQPVGYVQDSEVDAGSEPFSEVESRILRNFISDEGIDAAVFWHSSAGEVYPGYCNGSFLDAQALSRAYATAANYDYVDVFTAYPVTGDAADSLSLMGIPSIVVELTNEVDAELGQNLAGVSAILEQLVVEVEQ